MILFSEQLIRTSLRKSHISQMLTVVLQDGGVPVVFKFSSENNMFSRMSHPDKPVSTAPRLVTRELELTQTIEEGCQ